MNSSIAVLLTLLVSTVLSASTYFHANLPHSLRCYQPDTTLSDYELKLEGQYFAIDAILEEGVETEHVADSIKPYVKGLTVEFRERIYKEHKRGAVGDYSLRGPTEAMLFVPVIASLRQGDGIGTLTGLVGVSCLLAALSSNSTSEGARADTGSIALAGVGLLVYTAVRSHVVNKRNLEYNQALAGGLNLPDDLSYSLFPSVRNLSDGTIIPALSLNICLR